MLSFQRKDGLLPRAVAPWAPYIMILADTFGLHLEFKAPLRPNYTSEALINNIDCNAFLVWATLRYARASGDGDFVRRHQGVLERALAWYDGRMKDGLVFQSPFSDWQDSIARRGRVFYSNLIYWKGLRAMEELAAYFEPRDRESAAGWRARADAFAARLVEFFWDKKLGAFKNSDRIPGIESGANLLAAAWGLVGPEKTESILHAFDAPGVRRPLGLRATVPAYPWYMKSIFATVGGNTDYHDDQVWSWQTALEATVWASLGRPERGERALAPMAEVIAKDGVVGEVYDDDCQVKRRLFRSECPFTWGAGMWLEALDALAGTRAASVAAAVATGSAAPA
jgi:glycogen debranching enzyme